MRRRLRPSNARRLRSSQLIVGTAATRTRERAASNAAKLFGFDRCADSSPDEFSSGDTIELFDHAHIVLASSSEKRYADGAIGPPHPSSGALNRFIDNPLDLLMTLRDLEVDLGAPCTLPGRSLVVMHPKGWRYMTS